MIGPSEVSAVVLSVGEPYAQRAVESLSAQTIPLQKIVVVEHVSPFSRAINEGARQVSTPFFVQVDADMMLDPNCVEILLGHVQNDTGIVVGELRDALSGRIVGVKLFRTECFRRVTMPDSLSPDTDFGARLQRLGWRTEYVESTDRAPGAERPALGEHRPDYTPPYTYRKFLMEGGRLRHRAARHGLLFRMGTLEQSVHPLAMLAQLALGHGFFLRSSREELRPSPDDPRADWLVALLAADGRQTGMIDTLLPVECHARLRDVFERFLAAGQGFAQHRAGATVREVFAGLSDARRNSRALVARVALGHGLLMDAEDRAHLARDARAFRRFMVFSLGSRSNLWDGLRARALHLATVRRRSPSIVPW